MQTLGNKLLLERDDTGLPILAHVIQVASACRALVTVSYGHDDIRDALETYDLGEVAWVLDESPGRGPLAGVAQVLRGWTDDLFSSFTLVAGDLPGLTVNVLEMCLSRWQQTQTDGVAIVRDGQLQPLLATYGRHVANAMIRANEQGETRLMRALTGIHLEPITVSPSGHLDWRIQPIHTPEDYAAWRKWSHKN